MASSMVTLQVNGRQTGAYLTGPEGEGPWPGVVVIQEWWGLDEHIKDVADRFAEAGFVAIAPDLYYGIHPSSFIIGEENVSKTDY